MKEYLVGKYQKMTARIFAKYINAERMIGVYNGMVMFALEILTGFIYVYISCKALAGSISVGQVVMYAGAIVTMINAIRNMMELKIRINYSNEYLKTYEEFLTRPNMHYDGTLPIEKRDDGDYELEFSHVSFRYPGTEKDVLSDVSLRFKVREKLAVVGRNGAGKTTLIKLLLRLYEPTSGTITLNGIDIGKYDYQEYVQIFAAVFQDFRIYHLPLDENLAGSENVDAERVKTVLEQVGLRERVARMKDGAHTLLGHDIGDGELLSGGEEQKLAIARALYKDAPFVILDEPTAALDPIAEAEIYENFDALVGKKTAIYISHRMSSCKFCDRIIVLDSGRLAEAGTHETLMRQEGIYYALYEAQAKHYAE